MYPFLRLRGLKSSRNSSRLKNRRCELSLRPNYAKRMRKFATHIKKSEHKAILPRSNPSCFSRYQSRSTLATKIKVSRSRTYQCRTVTWHHFLPWSVIQASNQIRHRSKNLCKDGFPYSHFIYKSCISHKLSKYRSDKNYDYHICSKKKETFWKWKNPVALLFTRWQ